MNSEAIRTSIANHATISFVRSGGPGGQNVNKVNSKVFISIPIENLAGLSSEERNKIRVLLSSRISESDSLFLHVAEERSQLRNREIAEKRLYDLILQATTPVKPRRPTKPSKASRMKRLANKKIRSFHKNSRRPPSSSE